MPKYFETSIKLVIFIIIYGSTYYFSQSTKEYDIYLFIYESDQTESGAGHVSMAFGKDSSNLIYYTKYRQYDGGGRKEKFISYHKAFIYDREILKLQKYTPSMVLKLKGKLQNSADLEKLCDLWNIQKPWSLFINNCTDAVKRVLRVTKINPGVAFLISTPNELVEDLIYHNAKRFKNNEFQVLHGDLCFYLKNEPNAVPQTLFGKRKKRNENPKGDCY
ncbi:MAG: hypothetical protein FJZ67_10160 [Bacteroidetes bacterium]|nr:hypothetical protein [Bacteroidota bacterium]